MDSKLHEIARFFGQEEAVALLRDAMAKEEIGDFCGAVKQYKMAYRMWPALDSVDDYGLPRAVRREAECAGIDCSGLSEPQLETETSPRFAVSATEQWLSYLQEHGYVVLAGIADTEAVETAKSLLWEYLESVPETQVKRLDSSTWCKESGWLPSQGNGLLGGRGFEHSAFCWHTRLLPGVKQAFQAIWDCNDLVVSFDGGNVFRPWTSKPEWRTEGGWWHVDQNAFLPGKDGCVCVQGLVTFTDATPATGGLCVIPGSHREHKEVCQRAYSHELPCDFVPVQPGDPVFDLGARLVCARAGDLVLWDSRCVHCNTPGMVETEMADVRTEEIDGFDSNADLSAKAELLRVVGYVCMTPAAWAPKDVVADRKDAFISNVGTNHWPHEYHPGDPRPLFLSPNEWSDASDMQRHLIVGMLPADDSSLQP